MAVGCLIAGSDVTDAEAAAILSVAFVAGLGALTVLENRFPTKRRGAGLRGLRR